MHSSSLKTQTGAALVVSLLILLVMTVIGVSSMQTTNLEEKMASNTRDRQQAFEAAEGALRNAEDFIDTSVAVTANFDTDGSDGLYDNSAQELWKTISWTVGSDALEYTGYSSTYSYGAQAPRYIIEHYGTADSSGDKYNLGGYGTGAGGGDVEMFRISVRGTGANGLSPVFLQSSYGKIL
jgi:type IV pilus assembly protein PilX